MSEPDKTKAARRKLPVGQVLLIGLAFVAGFILLGALATVAWDYSNSVDFCSNMCHDVHPEEPAAYQDSYHASVRCTECHMGRLGTLQSIVLKAGHAKHLPAVLFDKWERPLESVTMRPANESCEMCHYPPAFHGDRLMEVRRFAPDEQNTGRRVYLILKTGGGERSRGLGYGIHWHISNQVEYIATDERKQDIRWIRSTLPDGRVVEYNDVTNPLSAEEIASLPRRTMDCVDCHNRVGHPFPGPEDAVDRALADNRISQTLPYVKKQMMDLLTANYSDQATAIAAAQTLSDKYRAEHPDVAAAQGPAIEEARQVAEGLAKRIIFDEPGVSWRSFPDNGKHKDFAGCFRCHDGKHVSSDGESIRLHCNICHSIPETVEYKARAPLLPAASVTEPESHLQTNFMAEHRFLANDGCSQCHGEVAFGTDDSNFCANSACHDRAWPAVELDAAFPHPIPLEGKHAETWCFSCHQGVKKPVYDCANCHQPPQPHFTGKCETCHRPTGWVESAAKNGMTTPKVPHELTGHEDCLMCHDPAGKLKPAPANHSGFESKGCVTCHEKGAAATASAAPTVGGVSVPVIPHPLEGHDNCLTCHDPALAIKPAPANHAAYSITQCTTCHKLK